MHLGKAHSGTRSSTACSAFITQNWRGKPLVSHQVIVQLIGATTTQTGLTVRCELDANTYPKGIKVTDAEMAALNIDARRIPRRVELHHLTQPTTTLKQLFRIESLARLWPFPGDEAAERVSG